MPEKTRDKCLPIEKVNLRLTKACVEANFESDESVRHYHFVFRAAMASEKQNIPLTLTLLVSDILASLLSFTLALWLRFGLRLGPSFEEVPPLRPYLLALFVAVASLLVFFWIFDLHKYVKERSAGTEIALVLCLVTSVAIILLAAAFFYRGFSYSRLSVLYFWILEIVFVSLGRLITRRIWRPGGGHNQSSGELPDCEGNTGRDSGFEKRSYDTLKLAADLLGATAGTIVLSPLFVMVGLMTWLTSKGPILHYRKVLGRNCRPFYLLKFRSMVHNANEILNGNPQLETEFKKEFKLDGDPRVTLLGRILRRTSIDELPQLFNVITGSMSLVGPRPVVPEELHKHSRWQRKLLAVRPGITGMWQVMGRNTLSYRQRIKYNLYYIKHRSFLLDAKISARTLIAVLKGPGVQ